MSSKFEVKRESMMGSDSQPSDLLTLAEAASRLRLKVSTLRDWILKRRLSYVKVGRLVRIRRSDLEALIEMSLVPARE
jgi:excisionase family DNA binding protein